MAEEFDLDNLLANPSLTQLDGCRKDELVQVANHFRIPFPKQILKRNLKALIVGDLVEQGVIVLPVRDELPVLADGALTEAGGSQKP